MKLVVEKGVTVEALASYLSPVEQYCAEKIRKGQYDDWDEAEHTRQWLCGVLDSINTNGHGKLNVYYLEKETEIIGAAFALYESRSLLETLKKDGVAPPNERVAQVTCFHIIEKYRGHGIGKAWLETEILRDLQRLGVQAVYIRSSHHRALPLYERLGKKVGNYISVSDHQLYQRYGYIFQIDL